MNPKNLLPIFFSALVLILSSACASSQKSDKHWLQQIYLYNLHYRRPPQIGARFQAERLETDFESSPKPNHKLDCEPLKSLFAGMDLAAIRQCLASVNADSRVKNISYKLMREVTPFLKLELEEDEGEGETEGETEVTPACFQQILQIVPVPREIYFQAFEAERLSCYNARIPLVADEVLGISDFLRQTRVNLSFPLTLPEGDEETLLLLGTWALAPFFNTGGYIESKVVTKSLCALCFEGKNLFLETDLLPPLWP